ncbi:hypothetical protein [Nocardia sp. NPDC050793]|uniref:hypothetical protein n=1 Tax=Nocardia sp. NPDC050793 TaxID=3155159 RepID=UPI0033DB3EC9
MSAEWIGKGNREDLTVPVLALRESAQRLGLLRKYKGRIVPTTKARSLHDDPVALWWHIAERLPRSVTRSPDREAGVLYLLALAGGAADRAGDIAAGTLTALGWRDADYRPITATDIGWITQHITVVLEQLGLLHRSWRTPPRLESGGVLLARAALRSMLS